MSIINPSDRSAWRDTFIYASDDRDTELGGLYVTEGMTNANLYSMVEIFCIISDAFDLQDDREQLVERDEGSLRAGNYYIVTNGTIEVTNEVPLVRTISLQSGTRVASFRTAVRERDRRCIITGRPAVIAGVGFWTVFQATHIFPLAYERDWNDSGFSHWFTVPPASESDGYINSVQNGVFLAAVMHSLFDSYQISINPNDNHKIVCFTPLASSYGIAGRQLDQLFLDDPLRPPDPLFRWHFRQAVLVNMKGAGEPCFETDFPPGSDMMGEIMSGPKAGERMEFELFGRLNAMGARA
ncbi:hypothetical protein L873DRAFT_1696889 [Choiromyces venosus 120613-1]|uniref:Uncharacterized protein n=1 Tax=Choiromyces venosus 120613-1 TaxID=1336337 RepID=A0A3N4JH20_9PEZI|nr:hypothetical protein L873DRAFT_1696889 [Choiromyces venosus 120613-1]